MDLSGAWAIIPLLVCLAASAFCSASETALFALSRHDRVRLRHKSPGVAQIIDSLLERPRQLLITILILNTVANVLFFTVSGVAVSGVDHPAAPVVGGAASVLVAIVFGEVVPKQLAALHRSRLVEVLARPLLIASGVVQPARLVLERFAVEPLRRVVAPARAGQTSEVSATELAALLEQGATRGAIDREEQRLLAEVVELRTTRVRDVMVPRVRVEWVREHADASEIVRLRNPRRLTRIPVCRGTIDDGVVGMLNVKKLLSARSGPKEQRWRESVEPATFVPESARLDQLLELFRATRTHVAVCVDELGSVRGLVDIDAIVDELVRPPGDLAGRVAEGLSQGVRREGEAAWVVPGSLGVREWAEFVGKAHEVDGSAWDGQARPSTVAGLILQRLGRVPKPGDTARFGNVLLQVRSLRGPAIDEVLVSILPPGQDAPEGRP